LGKRLLGLSVVGTDGRLPGLGRALLRLFIPIGCIEVVRVPFLLTTISISDVNAMTSAQVWLYVGASNVCPWLAVLLAWGARRENGFATVWDRISGTRVVVQLKGTLRAPLEPAAPFSVPLDDVPSMGPYQVVSQLVPGKWMVAFDALLRRPVWLIRPSKAALSVARKNVSRIGRLRWLQTIEADGTGWNAFEATPGTPFLSLVKDGQRVPWKRLRQWLHDLAAELWAARGDQTLPAELSLDHIWIARQGHAVLLDHPWPEGAPHAERIRVSDLAGQQRFLSAVAAYAEFTTLPLHARPVLQNLGAGKFEKLSFLAGHLRGLLDKPVEVTRQIRAGSMLLLPVYLWIMVFVGYEYERRGGGPETIWSSEMGTALATALAVLGVIAAVQLLELPFRSTASYAIFRLAVVDSKGERASAIHLLGRWAIMWLPLLLLNALVLILVQQSPDVAFFSGLGLLLLWIVPWVAFGLFAGCGQPQPPAVSLEDAAVQGNVAAIRQHVAAGSNLDARNPQSSATPLIVAAAFGQTAAAKALIQGGANLNLGDKDGGTALHAAAFLCHPEIVQALLEAGADKAARNNAGATALESVEAPFELVVGIYDLLGQVLGPAGLTLDYDRIKAERPRIARLLKGEQP